MGPGSHGSAGLNGASGTSMADAALFERLGRELRASYEALVEEPVPEHLVRLIRLIGDEEPDAE